MARICEICEKEIGENDKVCPACGTDFAALEEEISVVTRAQTIAEKRKKKNDPPPPPPEPETKGGFFSALARRKQVK